MSDLINEINLHVSACQSFARRLERLGHAFDIIGLRDASDVMFDIAEKLPESAKRVQSAHGLQLNEDLDRSREMAGLTLALALKNALPTENDNDET